MKNLKPPTAILLFGMPRSGTTWIGKIFDSSPETLYRHEPDSWGTLNSIPMFPDANKSSQYEKQTIEFLGRLSSARKTKVAGSFPIFRKAGESMIRHKARQFGVAAIKTLSNYIGELDIPPMLDSDPTRLVPVYKSIESTGRLGIFLKTAPDAKALHILRHPCWFVSSVLRGEQRNKFEGGRDSEDFGIFERLCELPNARRRSMSLAEFRAMSPAQRLAWRWLLVNEKAMEDCGDSKGYLPINYDSVCAEPESEARRMLSFAGLDWNDQTAKFVMASTGAENPTYYSVFKDPLKSAKKWKSELSEEQISQILEIVRDSRPGSLFI